MLKICPLSWFNKEKKLEDDDPANFESERKNAAPSESVKIKERAWKWKQFHGGPGTWGGPEEKIPTERDLGKWLWMSHLKWYLHQNPPWLFSLNHYGWVGDMKKGSVRPWNIIEASISNFTQIYQIQLSSLNRFETIETISKVTKLSSVSQWFYMLTPLILVDLFCVLFQPVLDDFRPNQIAHWTINY